MDKGEGVEAVRTFRRQQRGVVIFLRLCAEILWMDPKPNNVHSYSVA